MNLLWIALLYLLIGFALDMVLFYIFNKCLEISDIDDVEQFIIFVMVLLFWPTVIKGVLLCLASFGIAYPFYKLYMWLKNRRD